MISKREKSEISFICLSSNLWLIFVHLQEKTMISFLHWALFVLTMLFVMMVFIVFYFRRQYSHIPNPKLIASVNPEYVPTGKMDL